MMIDLEDKRIKIAVTSVVIVGFVTYYFYPKDDYVMEMVKPTRPPVEKIEKIEETPKKENIVISKVEEMKARKLGSEADKLDLDFLTQESGVNHERDMEKKDFDRLAKLDEHAMKAMVAPKKETSGK